MPRRDPNLITSEIYHIYNRGVEKRNVFLTSRDYNQFLKAIEHYRVSDTKLSRRGKIKVKQQGNRELVEVLSYCLMPNHFHLLLKQTSDEGVSKFTSKVINSFTKYFNIKNERVGPLFQGPFKAVRIESDEQLVHVSRYIHLNPLAINFVSNLKKYKWSSYRIYIGDEENTFVSIQEILSNFPLRGKYEEFVLDQADYAKNLEAIKHQLLE